MSKLIHKSSTGFIKVLVHNSSMGFIQTTVHKFYMDFMKLTDHIASLEFKIWKVHNVYMVFIWHEVHISPLGFICAILRWDSFKYMFTCDIWVSSIRRFIHLLLAAFEVRLTIYILISCIIWFTIRIFLLDFIKILVHNMPLGFIIRTI
jgi:hypothetical protein